MEEKILIKSERDDGIGFALIFQIVIYLLISFFCVIISASTGYYVALIVGITIGAIFFVLAIIMLILYFCYAKCELIITEKNIKGKTLFGKEVVLPLYMVSAFSIKKMFSVVAVATSSGFVKFGCVSNYKKIGKVLTSLINERQENTKVGGTMVAGNSLNLGDLKQLKELLDSGIITQEEFDAKKKQILGL